MKRWRAVGAVAALVLSMLSAPAAADRAAGFYYLHAGQVDLSALLAPPPGPGSPAQQRDERKIAQILATRTPEEQARAQADAQRLVFVFSDVLGKPFSVDRLPLTHALFDRVGSDTAILVEQAKLNFAHPRPAGVRQTHYSYPSGHAAFAACTAILLARMVPEKRSAIFARAAVFAENRIIAGVHFPSDVQAGWIAGTVVAAALANEPKFQADFSAAKAEVRAALGLP